MPHPEPPDWAAIRRRYEETDASIGDIAAGAGITRADLDRARKRWRRRKPRGKAPPRKAPAARSDRTPSGASAAAPERLSSGPPPKKAARRVGTSTPAGRRRLLDRLVALISLKLEQLERRMECDLDRPDASDPASATDHERETRAIGALIDNLGKVTEMETGLARTATGGKSAAADLAGEADHYRRELAERLRKIVDAAAAKP